MDALEEFRKEEKVAPENPMAYQALAAVLMQMNRRDDAIAEWRKLLKVDPENRTAASTLAAILSGSAAKPEGYAAYLLQLYGRCLGAGEREEVRRFAVRTARWEMLICTWRRSE